MRSAGAVSRRLKEVRYRYLSEIFRNHFKKIPRNCRFNKKYVFTDSNGVVRELSLCLFKSTVGETPSQGNPLDLSMVDVCQEIRTCARCNAFIYRYTKEELKALFEEELKNLKIRALKYPDICALEWVLEKSENKDLSILRKLYLKIKWRLYEYHKR